MTSPSSSAWQTPTATASWPIATCRKPGSSPARKRSSTFSSKRRIRSISRRKSRSRSSESARLFSTLATGLRSVRFARVSLGPAMAASSSTELPAGLGRGAACGSTLARPGAADRAAALLGPLAARRAPDGTLAFRVARDGSGPDAGRRARLLERLDRERIAARSSSHRRGDRPRAAPTRRPQPTPSPSLGRPALATPARRLERPLRRGRARLARLPRARGAALGAVNPRRDQATGSRSASAPRGQFGYGASPVMARALPRARCDEEGIAGQRAPRASRYSRTPRPVADAGRRSGTSSGRAICEPAAGLTSVESPRRGHARSSAPKRSRERRDDRARAASWRPRRRASARRLEGDRNATDLRPSPTCSPR